MQTPRPTRASSRWLAPLLWVELFILANISFLAVDIYLAHSVNAFGHPAEWIPFAYSVGAPIVLVAAMAIGGLTPTLPGDEGEAGPPAGRRRLARGLGLAVGWLGVAVGVAGLLYHLESQFFEDLTIKNLVYTAPFAAPLAYAGLGLLLILDRMVDARSVEWARWVALLAMGGFAGNFVLSLADHAQNGFFVPAEWLAVASGALAVGFLCAVVVVPDNRPLLQLCGGVMAAQAGVGLLGFYYHGRANLEQPTEGLWDAFVYGAPIFAPLLFANLAALAGIALVALWKAMARAASEPAHPAIGALGPAS